MKILVVTGRFGMGHVSAAEAVKEEQDSEEQLRHMLFDGDLLHTMRENTNITPENSVLMFGCFSPIILHVLYILTDIRAYRVCIVS